jgi:hypothetical protein
LKPGIPQGNSVTILRVGELHVHPKAADRCFAGPEFDAVPHRVRITSNGVCSLVSRIFDLPELPDSNSETNRSLKVSDWVVVGRVDVTDRLLNSLKFPKCPLVPNRIVYGWSKRDPLKARFGPLFGLGEEFLEPLGEPTRKLKGSKVGWDFDHLFIRDMLPGPRYCVANRRIQQRLGKGQTSCWRRCLLCRRRDKRDRNNGAIRFDMRQERLDG